MFKLLKRNHQDPQLPHPPKTHKKVQLTPQTSSHEVYSALEDVFVLFGLFARIDGGINNYETHITTQYATLVLHLEQEQLDYALTHYHNASTLGHSVQYIAKSIYKKFKKDLLFLLDLYDWVERIAICDGHLCTAEKDALKKVHKIFRLKKMSASIGDPYLMLGCTIETPIDEIKKAYRQKIAQYHPDTIMAIQPPVEFLEYNMGQFQKIKSAYELIKKKKRFS